MDANVERGKHLSSANNFWGRCVTNRSEVAKLSGGPSRASVELGDNRRNPNQRLIQTPRPELIDMNAPLAAIERQNTSAWPSVVTFFLEGFALCAASHCGLPPASEANLFTSFRPQQVPKPWGPNMKAVRIEPRLGRPCRHENKGRIAGHRIFPSWRSNDYVGCRFSVARCLRASAEGQKLPSDYVRAESV
jgi:hypothetical protein